MSRAAGAGSTRRAKAWVALSFIVPLALYGAFSWQRIAAGVGYQMDEALYVESAVYLLRGSGEPPFVHDAASWVPAFGRAWPIMIIPYVGTVKAAVALPLFAAFGIGAETARVSGVLFGALGIAGLVALVAAEASPGAALICGIALAIHPSYLDYTVFDNGGVGVWMGAMGLCALALKHHLERRSISSALLLGFAAGLGVWGRLNFLWLIAAALVAALVSFGRRAIPPGRHAAAIAIGGCVGAAPLIVYELASRFATLRFMSDTRQALSGQRLALRLRGLAEVMISAGEHRGIWGGASIPGWQRGVGAALLIAAGISFLLVIRPTGKTGPPAWRRAFSLAAVFLTGIMLSSRLGVGQHHLVAVLPLAAAALAMLGVEVACAWRRAIPLLCAAGAGLLLLLLACNLEIDRGLRRTGGRWYWSSGIRDVEAYLKTRRVGPDRLKILNWGFQNNLYVLSAGSVYGYELFWGATDTQSRRGMSWDEELRDGGAFLFFEFQRADPANRGFARALAALPGAPPERLFVDRSGSPYAALIEVAPAR